MAETFLLASKKSEHLRVEQLHINLWFFSYNKAFFDIGLLIEFKKEFILQEQCIDIYCRPLFKIKNGSLQELYSELNDEETLQIVFNDEVQSITNIGNTLAPRDARFICFKSARSFIIFKPYIEDNSTDDQIKISIDSTKLNKEVINSTFKDETVSIYLRFRYQVDIKKTSNIFFDSRILNDQIHFDFRFNEPRLFRGQQDLYQELIYVKSIFLFMIQPTYYRSRLQQDLNMKYIRLLEKEQWGKYIRQIEHEKGNFLVYYWRSKELRSPPNNDFNMLVSFEFEKVDFSKQLLTALVLILISYLSLKFSQNIKISQLLGSFTPFIQTSVNIIGGLIFAIGLGVATNAIYDYAKVYIIRWLGGKRNGSRNT